MGGGGDQGFSVTFWGTRGSHALSGADAAVFGGNTLCLEVRIGGRLVIIDAGTGLIGLGRSLPAGADIDLLLSHLHLDHIEGLPFFAPLFDKTARLRIACGNLGGASPEAVLDGLFRPPVFPVPLSGFAARLGFAGFKAGNALRLGNVVVRTCALDHPSGATGYRFEAGGRTLVTAFDVEHRDGAPDPALVAFCAGADVLVYDTTYTAADYGAARGWGHSTPEAAAALAARAGVKRLIGIHHNPAYGADALRAMEARLQTLHAGASLAREGMTLRLDAG